MPKKTRTKKRLQRVSIRAELRDEPDWDRFAWALLQHAKLVSASKAANKRLPKKASKP